MSKKILVSIGLLFLISFLFPSQVRVEPLFPYTGEGQPRPGTHAPIITHAYAVDKGPYGDILRFYIEAEDPDGDMLRIATVVNQVGYGYYPTNWTFIKSPNQRHLIGYLQWNTFSSRGNSISEWTRIAIRVSVVDKAGNESNEVVFPFTFESGPWAASKPAAPFDQGNIQRLGHIMIDLVGQDRHRDRRLLDD